MKSKKPFDVKSSKFELHMITKRVGECFQSRINGAINSKNVNVQYSLRMRVNLLLPVVIALLFYILFSNKLPDNDNLYILKTAIELMKLFTQ